MNNLNPVLYTIRSGDTLYDLATQYCTTVQELIHDNLALDPYNLRVGQQIYIYPHCNSMNSCISPQEVNLLKNMNLVWEQHIMWTRMLLISIAESLNDLEATKTRLLENPMDIANIFRSYYGNNAANAIQKLLTEHLVICGDLMVALKNNNQNLVKELTTKWYQNADDMAKAFASINPFYPEEKVRNMLYEHLRLTTEEVTARMKKDYSADIRAYDMVQKEILDMSQFFVDGIIK